MKKSLLLLFGIVCSCLVWGQISINTIDDLAKLATDIVAESGYAGQTIEINADLTVSKIWTPIGTAAQPFQGTVKGNGHIISGLGAVKGTDGIGVFGYVGAQATIEDLGIGTGHIKTMKNDVCLYVGALAGHNAGTINRCWNMATLEVNGTNVGGLVGWNEGEITDCYNAGPITKATDYIGGLVGTNKGEISYCYNIGFVRNGLGLVAKNEGEAAKITEGYYDRQLYIQTPDATHPDPAGVVAVDRTPEMFSLFSSREAWTNSADNYPILTKFKEHDAAQVSAASIIVIVDSTKLDNHINQLVGDFKVNLNNGVSWAKTSPIEDSWIVQDSSNDSIWNVDRPCRVTEVIMTANKNGHVREVVAIPMHIEDFLPGRWGGDSVMACLNEPLYLKDIQLKENEAPKGGVPAYKGKLVITRLADNVDSVMIEKGSWEEYEGAYKNSSWTPTKPGYYVIKRYAADSQCHIEWEKSESELPVFVPDSLKAGEIEARDNDSLCFADSIISILSTEEATCEGTTISYYWTMNEDSIKGQTGASLTDFALPQPNKYTFKRYAYNNACEPRDKAKAAKNEYTVTLLAEFKEGKISSKKSWSICDPTKVVEEVGTISAQAATGGDTHITYQWYMGDAAIEGENAKKQDLTLSSVTLPATFVYGQTYIFYRTAKDGKCQTTPVSTDTVKIEVYPEFKEGDIQPAIEDSLCWTANHTITVGSATAATFGGLTVHYYWTVNGVEISNSDSETLTYELSEVKEYTFKRYAYNDKCVSKTEAIPATTVYTVTLLKAFEPGSIESANIVACSVADALEKLSTIIGTTAEGGDGDYTYSWEMYENGVLLQLEDEDGKDLDLTKYVTMNARYEFTRKAKDRHCNTEGQLCDGKVIIEIYGEITPGQIENKTIDMTCLNPQVKEIEVNIASERPATTERGVNIVYTWYLVKNGVTTVVGGNDKDLSSYKLSLEGINSETEFTFYRTAYNSSCGSDEVKANGQTKVIVSFGDTIYKEVVLCESQFEDGKYVYSYPNQQEARISHTFYLDKIEKENTWIFRDPIEADCRPQVTIKVFVIPAPKIETENVAEVCQEGEDGTLPIYFRMKKGSANMYSIELSEGLRPYFDNKSHIEGTMPLVNEGEAGVITLHCKRIGYLGGEKIMYLQVGVESEEAGQSTCFCTPSEIRLTVTQGGYIENKYDKVLFIDNNPKKETDPKFTAYQWYKNGILVEGATGQYYHEGGATLVGSYFADLTYTENGKEMVMRTCTLQMPVEAGRKAGVPTGDVTKQLEDGQIVIQRAGAKYNIFGSKMSNL